MPDTKERKESKREARSRLGFSTWMLLVVGGAMVALHLCRNQGTLERLEEWDFYLRGAGEVILLSGNPSLGKTKAGGVNVLSWNDFPEIRRAAVGADASSFRAALLRAGVGAIIVGRDLLETGEAPGRSVLHGLAASRPVEGFHALMIRPQGAIYEIAPDTKVSEEKIQELIETVRKMKGKPGGGGKTSGDFEVALQLQGLEPRLVEKKKVLKMRRDLFATGRGATLESAALEAARDLKRIFKKKFTESEGDFEEALGRYTIELHVLFDFSLLDHIKGDLDSAAYRDYLDSIIQPGIHGVYVNRLAGKEVKYLYPPRSKLRLPADAIYWMRQSGGQIVERIVKEMNMGGLEKFAASRRITLDRFRTIHAAEGKPGGKVRILSMAAPVVSASEVTEENVREWGGVAARWIGRSIHGDALLPVSYLPYADTETVEKPEDVTFFASRYVLGAMALLDAAQMAGEADYRQWFEMCRKWVLGWLRFCPEAASAARKAGVVLGASQVLGSCGPMRRDGTPAPVEKWGQGGKEERDVPGDLVFIFANTRAGLEETALAGIMTAEEILAAGGKAGKERRRRLLPILEGIGRFALFMQRDDGSFQGFFVDPKNAFYRAEDISGGLVATLFLARAAGILKEKKLVAALKKAVEYYGRFVEEKAAAAREDTSRTGREWKGTLEILGWGLMALAEASSRLEDEEAARRAVDAALNIVSAFQIEGPGGWIIEPALEGGFAAGPGDMPDYRSIVLARGIMHAARAARRWSMDVESRDLEKAAVSAMRFSSQLQARSPWSSFLGPNPERTEGGVRQSLTVMRQRIDFTAHFVGACRDFVEIF